MSEKNQDPVAAKSAGASTADRKARAAQFQADLAAQDRRRRLLVIGGVVGAVVLVGGGVLVGVRGSGSPSPSAAPSPSASASGAQIVPSTPTGAVTVETAPSSVAAPPGIEGLLAWDTAGYPGPGTPGAGTLTHDHVDGPVTYAVVPPVGGPHSAVWMNAGVYTAPVPSERAVHDMEHGAVWITYDPALAADQVDVLTALVAKQSLIAESGEGSAAGQANRYVVMSPWAGPGLPSPIVISSWGYQLRVSDPADPRLQQFIDTFRNSTTYSPEAGSPVDGVPVLTGGRAASNGGVVPNPEGAAA